MSRIRAAATACLAAVEQAVDVLRANLTTARQWLQTLGATDQPSRSRYVTTIITTRLWGQPQWHSV
jgi:hypothetical protein